MLNDESHEVTLPIFISIEDASGHVHFVNTHHIVDLYIGNGKSSRTTVKLSGGISFDVKNTAIDLIRYIREKMREQDDGNRIG